MDQFRIPRNQIVHGLLSGVKLDVVFPGFPTMKHLPHTAELHFADIRVFQHPSKKQSMILKIASQPELEKVCFVNEQANFVKKKTVHQSCVFRLIIL